MRHENEMHLLMCQEFYILHNVVYSNYSAILLKLTQTK